MRGKRPLGKRGFGIMKIQILSFPEQLSSEGTSFEVSHLLWGTKFAPPVTGRIGYVPGDGFYVEMTCFETDPLRRQTGFQVPVYLDSAMEAFFHFPFSGKRSRKLSPYINLEFNANGALLAQYGFARTGRTLFSEAECRALSHHVRLMPDCWKLTFHLPLSLLEQIYGITKSSLPDTFSCNFYKISEDPSIEHYAAFSPLLSDTPDFHRPEFFEKATF